METRGIKDSPSRVGSGRLCAGALEGGKSACRAAGTAIILMVAEARKRKTSPDAHEQAPNQKGTGTLRVRCGIICR